MQIKNWDELMLEMDIAGTGGFYLKSGIYFNNNMRYLCGAYGEIESFIVHDLSIEINFTDNNSLVSAEGEKLFLGRWTITEDMVKLKSQEICGAPSFSDEAFMQLLGL